jgi:hypothetical protein
VHAPFAGRFTRCMTLEIVRKPAEQRLATANSCRLSDVAECERVFPWSWPATRVRARPAEGRSARSFGARHSAQRREMGAEGAGRVLADDSGEACGCDCDTTEAGGVLQRAALRGRAGAAAGEPVGSSAVEGRGGRRDGGSGGWWRIQSRSGHCWRWSRSRGRWASTWSRSSVVCTSRACGRGRRWLCARTTAFCPAVVGPAEPGGISARPLRVGRQQGRPVRRNRGQVRIGRMTGVRGRPGD